MLLKECFHSLFSPTIHLQQVYHRTASLWFHQFINPRESCFQRVYFLNSLLEGTGLCLAAHWGWSGKREISFSGCLQLQSDLFWSKNSCTLTGTSPYGRWQQPLLCNPCFKLLWSHSGQKQCGSAKPYLQTVSTDQAITLVNAPDLRSLGVKLHSFCWNCPSCMELSIAHEMQSWERARLSPSLPKLKLLRKAKPADSS